MKRVNISHLTINSDINTAHILMVMLGNKIDTILSSGISRAMRYDKYYYSKVIKRYFDIDEAIVEVKKIIDNPSKVHKNFDYQRYLDVLIQIHNDRTIYGDSIPNTSDVWDDLYNVVKRPLHDLNYDRVAMIERKRVRRNKFVSKFSNANIIWS